MKTAWTLLMAISCLALLVLGVYYGIRGDYAHGCFCLLVTVVARQKGI